MVIFVPSLRGYGAYALAEHIHGKRKNGTRGCQEDGALLVLHRLSTFARCRGQGEMDRILSVPGQQRALGNGRSVSETLSLKSALAVRKTLRS